MANTIKLPMPQKDLAFPLMKALERRRSIRKWTDEPLLEQELSNLLWAACGITKEETKRAKSKRTAPSACNSQAIKIYVAMKKGFFLYVEKDHQLIQILSKDIREHIGTQKMMHSAPVGLIYVSDFSKMKTFLFKDNNRRWFISAADTGFISQNVYLYCAAMKLSTVILGLVNREKLHEIMDLKEYEKVIYTQVVGYSFNKYKQTGG
ncbi:MAG: nitroreductase family protein [Atribacterota bacterium]|nr:nitroreductase family protein [Atribacterota bacterium]